MYLFKDSDSKLENSSSTENFEPSVNESKLIVINLVFF